MPSPNRCGFCHQIIPTINGMKRHCARKVACRKLFLEQNAKSAFTVWDEETQGNVQPPFPSAQDGPPDLPTDDETFEIGAQEAGDQFFPSLARSPSPEEASEHQSKRPRVTIEEIEDEDAPHIQRYTYEYPREVATALRSGQTRFECMREQQEAEGLDDFAPFASEDEWGMAEWLMKNVGQNKTEEFLKLPMVSTVYCSTKGPITYRILR